jgi:hypothetical protein
MALAALAVPVLAASAASRGMAPLERPISWTDPLLDAVATG